LLISDYYGKVVGRVQEMEMDKSRDEKGNERKIENINLNTLQIE